jgi:hypothetical protein
MNSAHLARRGDWGRVAQLRLRYGHPRTSATTTIDELVRVPPLDAFVLRKGGVDQSPMLGHPAERPTPAPSPSLGGVLRGPARIDRPRS